MSPRVLSFLRPILPFLAVLAAPSAPAQTTPFSPISPTPALTPPPATPLPIPAATAQAAAQDMIRKLFKADFDKKSPADRAALAKLLIRQAQDTRDDAAARYVALTEAADLAAGTGDARTAFAAV